MLPAVALFAATGFVVSPPAAIRPQVAAPAVRMSAAEGEIVPDMQRRTIMNLVLLGGAGVPVLWLAGGFIYFLVPPSGGGGGAGLVAKDALGADVMVQKWATEHPFP